MAYFIVNVGTEQKYRKRNCVCDAMYETEKGAKTACTKLNKKYGNTKQWEVMTHAEFTERFPVKYEMVRNLMSGKMVKQAVGTPLCCDVSSETYWSM
jgi:hypothetical protein